MQHYLQNNLSTQNTFKAKLLLGVLDFIFTKPLSSCICNPNQPPSTKLTIALVIDCQIYEYTAEPNQIYQVLQGFSLSGDHVSTPAEVLAVVRASLHRPQDLLLRAKTFLCKSGQLFQRHPNFTVQLTSGTGQLIFAGNGAPVLVGA